MLQVTSDKGAGESTSRSYFRGRDRQLRPSEHELPAEPKPQALHYVICFRCGRMWPPCGAVRNLALVLARSQRARTCSGDERVSYTQGQSPEPRTREYFYYVDHQGQVCLACNRGRSPEGTGGVGTGWRVVLEARPGDGRYVNLGSPGWKP